jgi:DNA helicase-2/ATP-dependent DNA helicase PcrA
MTKFDENYQKLNTKQKEAVDQIYGPVLVLAGPGTGKTQVIALRIANILKKTDVNPFNILCLTFTNAGMKAMRDRLVALMGVDGYKVVIHTFHSFCGEVIAMNPERFLFAKRTTQISDLQKLNLGKTVIDGLREVKQIRPLKSPYYYLGNIMSDISSLKREGLAPTDFHKIVLKTMTEFGTHEEYYHEKGRYKGKLIGKYADKLKKIEKNLDLALFYQEYQTELIKNGWFDFDDMILSVLSEFQRDRNFLADFQEKYMFLLVDEYQDTNGAQNKLLELLALDNDEPNIFAVGDNDQSIYRFQGASLSNLLFFKQIFPKTKVVVLKDCYRCSEMIMGGAREMMNNAKDKIEDYLQIQKEYIAKNQNKQKINLAEFESGQVELFFLAEEIRRLIVEQKVEPKDIAVFFRNNADAKDIIDVLKKYEIDFRIPAGENVLDSVDIKKLIKILRLLDDTDNARLLFEVMNFDFFGLDAVDVMNIFYTGRKERSCYQFMINNYEKIEPRKIEELKNFVETLQNMINDNENKTFIEVLENIIKKSGMIAEIAKSKNKFERLGDIKSFFDFVKEASKNDHEYNSLKLINDIAEMAENGIKVTRENLDFDGKAINLMTAHGSKGLEFEYVFVYKCIDKHWSNGRNKDKLPVIEEVITSELPEEKVEEERRLFYVAMTRAKNNLYLTWSKSYGTGEAKKETNKAMFVEEIGENHTYHLDTKKYHEQTIVWLEKYFGLIAKDNELPAVSREYVAKILENYALSPTGLNKYLKCPRKFFYEDILRIPKAKSAILSFGTAVHSAMENFYIDYKNNSELPDLQTLLIYYEQALKREVMTKDELANYLKEGKEYLGAYFNFYQNDFQKPLYNEFSFSRGHLVLDDRVILTGKVDRVEMLEGTKDKVRVVDYKTTKPKSRNQIMGLTKSGDGDYFRQLVFYKLLGDLAGYFIYDSVETELDFVIPNDKGVFKKERFEITSKEVGELKELILKVWDNIQNQKFGCCENGSECENHYGKCEFWDLCHRK